MAKVTQGIEEIRGSLKRMLRPLLLTAMEQWGFESPDKIEFTWSIEQQAILLHVRWGRWTASHYVDEDHISPIFIQSFVEMLAQDANVPIAQEL